MNKTLLATFADYTAILMLEKDHISALTSLQSYLNKINSWPKNGKLNSMKINQLKSTS